MRLAHERRIDGRELYVVDDVFDEDEVLAITRRVMRGPAERFQADRPDTRKNLAFAVHFRTSEMLGTFVGERMVELVERYFPKEPLQAAQFYCNLGYFGDSAYPHRDCDEWSNGVTALVFPNPIWELDWGGETLFYNDAGDCVTGVNPKPGRVALFRGAITHRPGLVIRECYVPRLTLACKFADLRPPPPGAKPIERPVSARLVCKEHNSRFCGCQDRLAEEAKARVASATA